MKTLLLIWLIVGAAIVLVATVALWLSSLTKENHDDREKMFDE